MAKSVNNAIIYDLDTKRVISGLINYIILVEEIEMLVYVIYKVDLSNKLKTVSLPVFFLGEKIISFIFHIFIYTMNLMLIVCTMG